MTVLRDGNYMRLQILSDLHLEFDTPGHGFEVPDVGADVVILRGDIDLGVRAIDYAAPISGATLLTLKMPAC